MKSMAAVANPAYLRFAVTLDSASLFDKKNKQCNFTLNGGEIEVLVAYFENGEHKFWGATKKNFSISKSRLLIANQMVSTFWKDEGGRSNAIDVCVSLSSADPSEVFDKLGVDQIPLKISLLYENEMEAVGGKWGILAHTI